MSRHFVLRAAIASCPLWLFTLPAHADCDASLAEAHAIARNVAVSINAPAPSRAGVQINISWANGAAAGDRSSLVPLFIVIAAPPEVRLQVSPGPARWGKKTAYAAPF